MSYGDFASVAGAKKMLNTFKQSVKPMDVLVGALLAQTAGRAVGSFMAKQLTKDGAPASNSFKGKLVAYKDEIGGIAVGAGLFVAQKGKGRAPGHLVGAVGGALLPRVSGFAVTKLTEAKIPGFAELAPINYGALLQMGELQRMGDFADFASADFNGLEEEANV